MSLLVVANAVFASAASIINLARLKHAGAAFWLSRAIRGVFAAFYAALYWATIFGAMSTGARVGIAQASGPFVWALVWIVPAFTATASPAPDRVADAVASMLEPPDDDVSAPTPTETCL